MTAVPESDRINFLLLLARALHIYGAPAHRLEEAVQITGHALNLEETQVFSTPTSLFISVGPLHEQRTYLNRIEPGEVNLSKLAELDVLLEGAARGRIDVESATANVRAILAAPNRYNAAAFVASTTVIGSAATLFFGGRLKESLAAAVIGLLVGLLAIGITRFRESARLFEFFAGASAAAIAVLSNHFYGPVGVYTVVAGGLIILLPGMTLTIAINELATRNLVSGTSRFMGAIMVLVSLGIGVAAGLQLARIFPVNFEFAPTAELNIFLEPFILAVTAVALMILFGANPREYLWICLAGILSFYGARAGTALLGPGLGAGLGAFTVGVASNLYSRLKNKPAVIMLLPGTILLVPGVIGFMSFTSLHQGNVIGGIEGAFSVLLVGVSIVAGLLMGNIAVRPRHML